MKKIIFTLLLGYIITVSAFSSVYAYPDGYLGYDCNRCHIASGGTMPNDTEGPFVMDFRAPSAWDSYTVPITSFVVINEFRNVTVESGTNYMISELSIAPSASDSDWSATPPINYTFDTQGWKTLYACAKDVTLDGDGSTDPDNDPLTYFWSFDSWPQGSRATLSDPSAVFPSFTIDEPGTYVVILIVNDGTVDSDPDTIVISTENTTPVSNAG